MSEYSGAEKFLHRFYLSNYFISKASFEMEESLFGKEINKQKIEQIVFVTGLARSGTTAVMRKLYETGAYASLTYNNMPFLFMPNLWKSSKETRLKERAHKDGILVNSNSPEEFDEYFWKVFLKNSYIKNELIRHDVPESILQKYRTYIGLICHSQKKNKYISKNNNNILRLESLNKIENSKIIFLYRHPLDHSASLLKLHMQFSEMQKKDPFIEEYFNFLGHHEFGNNHKPFLLSTFSQGESKKYSFNDINYWMQNWINYYGYLVEMNLENFELIAFEDLIHRPEKVYAHLYRELSMEVPVGIPDAFKPTTYIEKSGDHLLMDKAMDIFERLNSFRRY